MSTLITKINIAIHIFWHWDCEKVHMHRYTRVVPRYLVYIGCYMKKVSLGYKSHSPCNKRDSTLVHRK